MNQYMKYAIICWCGTTYVVYHAANYKAAVNMYRYEQAVYGEENVAMYQMLHDYGEVI